MSGVSKPLTNVVIVCWNALEYTKITLESLFATTLDNYFLTIINNGSNDDTADYLKSIKIPSNVIEYSLINNSNNLGIGYAYNQGYEKSKELGCKYTAFCNNDLLFSNEWLTSMEGFLEENCDYSMINPIRPSINDFHPNGERSIDVLNRCYGSPSDEMKMYSNYEIGDFDIFCNNIKNYNKNKSGSDFREVLFPDSLSSCVCLVRNSSLAKFGYFANPIFKRYGGEDIDICWRLMKVGYRCGVINTCYVHHFRNKSMKDNAMDIKNELTASNKVLSSLWKEEIAGYMKENNLRVDDLRRVGRDWLIYKIFKKGD